MKKLWYVFIHVDGGAIVSDQRLTRVEANKIMDNSKVSMDFFELGLDYAFCQNVFVSCYGFEDEQEAKRLCTKINSGTIADLTQVFRKTVSTMACMKH